MKQKERCLHGKLEIMEQKENLIKKKFRKIFLS